MAAAYPRKEASEKMSSPIDDDKNVEEVESASASQHDDSDDQGISPAERRKTIHKIDRRLITATGLLFGISLMDRTNLGSAEIAGMAKELNLTVGYRYSLIIILFFVPYVIFQWPSAILVRKVGPRLFLPGVAFVWGIVMVCFGFVHHWTTLLGLRVIVGIFEAGLFPGALYLLQMWYCRYDVHKRLASFYLISVLAGSLSGVLAFGFMQMSGVDGYLGWRWIFIWEGVLTVLIAIVGAFLIIDFPQKAQNSRRFLKPHEIAYVIKILEADRGDTHEEPLNWGAFFRSGLDVKLWLFGVVFCCQTITAYAISYFLPIILNSKMGYGVGISQVLSTPPYFWSAILMYFQGWLGDKYRIRAPIILVNSLFAICGLCLLAWTKSAVSQYFGIFLVTGCVNSSVPTVMAYQANNIRGQWKRAFASASLITFGGLGGIFGALAFRSQDAPQYLPGIYTSIACSVLTIVVVCGLSIHLWLKNKKADRGEAVNEGLTGFRYTL